MEDMDEARTAGGTVADFSEWDLGNKYGKMKLTTTEKIIEPTPEPEVQPEGFINKSKQRAERLKALEEERARLKAEEAAEKEAQKKRRPGTNSFNINVKTIGEVKELAKTLLPKVNEMKQEEYEIACELAINLAVTFEAVFEQRLGGNGVKEEQK